MERALRQCDYAPGGTFCKPQELRVSSEIRPARISDLKPSFDAKTADLPLMQPTNFEFLTCQDHGSFT
jgi:hypothetical protein